MAPKKKGKGKGKKKKGRSGSPSRAKKGKKMDSGQANTVLTFVMVESRKQSVLLYRTQFMEQKAELKALREKLRRVQHDRYGYLRNVLDTTDAITGKLETMQASPNLGLMMDLASDMKLVHQQETIETLHDILHSTTQILAGLTSTHATLQSSSAMASLSETVDALRTAQIEQSDRHAAEVALLRKRHQAAIDGSVRRGEKIVMGVEGSASQNELDTMPTASIATLQRNVRLKAKTKAALVEVHRLDTLIRDLHELNLSMVCDDGDMDWDLGLGIVPSDDDGDDTRETASEQGTEDGGSGDESWAKYRLKLPLLPTGAHRTALTLDPETVLQMERVRRERQILRSGLGVVGKHMELGQVEPRNHGGHVYMELGQVEPRNHGGHV